MIRLIISVLVLICSSSSLANYSNDWNDVIQDINYLARQDFKDKQGKGEPIGLSENVNKTISYIIIDGVKYGSFDTKSKIINAGRNGKVVVFTLISLNNKVRRIFIPGLSDNIAEQRKNMIQNFMLSACANAKSVSIQEYSKCISVYNDRLDYMLASFYELHVY